MKRDEERFRRLVGRAAELAIVIEAIEDAAGGAARIVAITGPAGIGKTRLLDEACRYATWRGWRILRGAGTAPPGGRHRTDAPARRRDLLVLDPGESLAEDGWPSVPPGHCVLATLRDLRIPAPSPTIAPTEVRLGPLAPPHALELIEMLRPDWPAYAARATARETSGHPGRLLARLEANQPPSRASPDAP